MSLNFFKSKDVKIFPCYSRGSYTNGSGSAVFDPEARLITETNFTNIYGNVFGQRSYIIGVDVKSDVAKFVINGYSFEISNWSTYNISGTTLYIKLESIILTEGSTDVTRTTYSLASLKSPDITDLDTFVRVNKSGSEEIDLDNSYYECTAIGYGSNDLFLGEKYYSLTWDNALRLDTLENVQLLKESISNTAGSSSKTVTGYEQTTDGKIQLTYKDIAFPAPPTEEEFGVLLVAKKPDTAITVDNTDEQKPLIGLDINNTGNVVLSQTDAGLSANIDLSGYELTDTTYTFTDGTEDGTFVVTPEGGEAQTIKIGGMTAAEALEEAKKYADENDANTAHTHSNGTGTKVTLAGGTSEENVQVNLNIAFELVDGTIKLYDKDDATKAAIASLDASEFIKDGMLNNVSYDAATNKLTFTWNTDAGEKTNAVTLSDILDPYVFEEDALIDITVEGTKVTIAHKTVVAPTETPGSGRTYLTGVTTDNYGHITGFTTASEEDQNLSSYKIKQTSYNSAGDAKKTITNVNQNENGEIEVIYSAIDFSHNHDEQYKKLQTAIEAVETEKNTFIDTVAQNANGEITITTKTVDFGDYDTSEVVDEKIAEALQEAKDSVVYDDTALVGRVTTVEGAVEDIETRVSNNETSITDLSTRLDGIVAVGGEPNIINSIRINGKYLDIDADKTVDINLATEESVGLMSASDFSKLAGIDEGANKTIIDGDLNSTSANPVQNKVVNTALASKANQSDLNTVSGKVDTLIGEDTSKSARSIAAEEVAKVVANAPEDFNTLKELADWISTHGSDAAEMNSAIIALKNKLADIDSTVVAYVEAAIAALKIGDYAKAADLTALAGRVTTLEAKPDYELPIASGDTLGGIKVGDNLSIDEQGVLSATDTTYEVATADADGLMSAEHFEKLAGIDEGANAYELPEATTSSLGGVKIGDNINVTEDGTISVAIATTATAGLMSAEDKTKVDSLDTSISDAVQNLATDDSFVASVTQAILNTVNTAPMTLNIYAVAFDANGGNDIDIMLPQVSIGGNYTLPPCSFTPCNSCYKFMAWGTSPDPTKGEVFAEYAECTLSANTIFYALWESKHDEAIDEAKAPTCTATGLTEGKHCSVCGEVLVAQEVVDALDHDHQAVVTDPTCTEDGYTTHTCHCGDTYIDTYVDALEHELVSYEAKVPTCTEPGWDTYVACQRTGCEYTTKVEQEALGHTWGETIYDFAEDGSRCTATRRCTVEGCNAEETVNTTDIARETLDATCTTLGQITYTATFQETWAGQHALTVEGYTPHDYENNICTVCGNEAPDNDNSEGEGLENDSNPEVSEET